MNRVLICIVCAMLGGCSFIPKYHRPPAPIAQKWNVDSHVQGSIKDISWDKFIQDARLQALIERSLTNNRDYRIAVLNVEEVYTQYRMGQGMLIPSITGEVSGLRKRVPASDSVKGASETSSEYRVGAGVPTYELDLFGRLRSYKRAALENYFATQEAQISVQITLVSQVAVQYLTVQALDEQLEVTNDALKSSQEYYDLIKKMYELGNASELDLHSVEAQMQTAQANLASYERQRLQAVNALELLVGEPLGNDLPKAQLLDTDHILMDLPGGVPSDLLVRRPDILEAEHQLIAANANIGAARAAFFPKVTLTGFAGSISLKLKDLFTGGPAWNFTPEITIPIFDAGQNAANLDVAKIRKRIEIARYEKAVQTAFREVADGLAARDTYKTQVAAQEQLVSAEQKRYNLADVRYRQGVDSYLTVLTAQQDLYSAQQSLIQARFNQLANLVTLYRALGGGWDKTYAR